MVSDQFIMGGMGAVSLNQLAIHEIMRLYHIDNKQDTFEKVTLLGRHFIKKMNDDAKNK